MGLELARAYITVRGDSSNLRSDFQQIQGDINNTLRDIAAGATALMAPIARFGQGILSEGLKSAGWLEQVTIEMETMIGSAEETQKMLKRLTRFAVETPFEMPQLMNIVRGLVQFGERGDELFETLKILGDASGGTAEKFGILGLVFNQIRGAGRLMRQDFLQLSQRGIISLQDIAKFYKVSTQEADKMLSSGKVTFAEFRKIMKSMTEEGGRYANMMQKQSTSLIGLKSTLNDSINIIKRLIAEPLMPYLKEFYAISIKIADAIGQIVTEGGPAISFAFTGSVAFSALGASIMGATFAAKLFGITIQKALIGSGVGLAVVALGAAVGYLVYQFDLLGKMKSGFSFLYDLFSKNKVATENFKNAIYSLPEAFNKFYEIFAESFGKISTIFYNTFVGFFKIGDFIFQKLLVVVSKFAMETAEWIQALSMSWSKFFKAIPYLAAAIFSSLLDLMDNIMNNVVAIFQNGLSRMLKLMVKGVTEMGLAMLKLEQAMPWNKDKSEAQKKKEEQMLRSMVGKEGKKLEKAWGVDNPQEMVDLMKESDRTKALFKAAPLSEFGKELLKNKRQIEKDRKNRKFESSTPETTPNKTPETPKNIDIKAGMYGIPQFAEKIQSALLDKADPALKTNSLLEESNRIQRKQLDSLKGLKISGGLE